ncbi:TonB-dependent receptor [Limnobacter sp.]|uniref:TonB-dependent receptor n=1 Tax=Limnobacter sp. TaxID=2003368 RepID=UPI0035115216
MSTPFKRGAVSLAAIQFVSLALALAPQSATAQGILESVVVTGQTSTGDVAKPFAVVESDTLLGSGATTVGEALRNQPGTSATGFGPNASRPIVRGQDADRIKILRNSAASVDVSALSFDHALPVDPFSLTQVEILRGPAALAYGGNAVGGAINLVDQRIARTPVQGIQSEFNALVGGAADQTAGGFKMDAGLGQGVSLHLGGFKRTTRDLEVPPFTDPDGVRGERVRNSSSKSDGASVAASVSTRQGYVGVLAERYNSNYGVPKSTDVRIGMEQERYALEGEQSFNTAAFSKVRYRLAKTDYQHREFEDGNPATLFINDGVDGRLELDLQAFVLGGFNISTTTGLQFERIDFSAVGDEAFVPSTATDQTGVFTIVRASKNPQTSGTFEVGIRADQVDVNAASSGVSPLVGPVAGGGVTGGPAINRSFAPTSLSMGYTTPIGSGWSLGGSISRVERAPSGFELYADGVHVATDAYEKGNPNLREERGRHLELTSTWEVALAKFSATAFASRYSNYIALIQRSGANSTFSGVDGEGNPFTVPVFDFTAVPAEFTGLELAYSTQYALGKGQFKPRAQYDLVRGKRTDGGGNLPRISPQRVVLSSEYAMAGWSLTPEYIWVDDSKASPGDPSVNGYNLLNFTVAKALKFSQVGGEVFASLQNITDELAFSATTLNTVRGYTPLPGRSALLGLKLVF